MKQKSLLALLLLAATSTSMFIGCGNHHDPYAHDGINWDGDNGGTLELINGSSKDMILFVGQVPSQSSMLGGVRAGATVKHDISKHVSDFSVGGYAILRGVTKEEYDKNPDPAKAKVEFNAMVTYKGGTIYRYNINPNYMGDNGFRVTNNSRIGMELRKNSPDGEKVAYLPALQVNQMVYTQTTEALTLFPVYVFYNKSTGEVTTLKSTDIFASSRVNPMPLNSTTGSIPVTYFPNDGETEWAKIVGTLKQYTAYIKVYNGVPNQAADVTIALSNPLISQSGLEAVPSGNNQIFEVESTDEGSRINLIISFYAAKIIVPVRFEDETTIPIIKNGYNYTVNVDYLGGEGGIQNSDNYKATIVEGSKRDISDQIESL